MNQYEVMYILDTTLEDQARQDLINRFAAVVTANGGQVDRIDEWGKRRLAYAIDYKTEGYYVLMYNTAPAELPREMERNLKIADAVLRYLVIRFEGELPAKREPLKPSAPAQSVAPVSEKAPEAAEEAAPEAQEAAPAETAEAAEPAAQE